MSFGRIGKTAELLTYIRTLKMYGWELLFAKWLMKTRSSEVAYLSVRKLYFSYRSCCTWTENPDFRYHGMKLTDLSPFTVRLGSIWMPGVFSFGQQHPLFSLCSHLDSIQCWVTSLMQQRYISSFSLVFLRKIYIANILLSQIVDQQYFIVFTSIPTLIFRFSLALLYSTI